MRLRLDQQPRRCAWQSVGGRGGRPSGEAAEILRATLDVARPALGAEHRLSLALTKNLAAWQGGLKRRKAVDDAVSLSADEN